MSLRNELSSLSYTNKDFNSIYTELLEYVKKLSYRWDPSEKWDPSESDESDPGVVLLKLAAIVADKNNYNIDTSVLELMPASVTQLPAARQLFEQCGYYMPYYQAAQGKITLAVSQSKIPQLVANYIDSSNETIQDILYRIPPFTMVTDVDTTTVYTITPNNELSLSGSTMQSYEVMEGVAVEYTINNDPLITLSNLDSRNRLYFTDYNIAENGIFITNVTQGNSTNYDEWTRVDNLEVAKKGSRCYKFGLTVDSSLCYIEFPDDIEYVIGEGINITYIKTSGKNGNIGSKKLQSFYVDTKFFCVNINEDVVVTSENITINNPLPILTGSDPEDIDSAYKSYKRVKDTFNTLVSLKDYEDYMIHNNYASNGYVCDRTNDIQHAYKILQEGSTANVLKTVIEDSVEQVTYIDFVTGTPVTVNGVVPSMTPYDLSIYALEYKPVVENESDFQSSFKLVTAKEYETLINTFEDVKSIQHNFKDYESNKILMIKNKYPILATIIPKYKIDTVQQYEIYDNVRKALFNAVNSKELVFGEAVSYDMLYDVVSSADARIKAASVEYPVYETYAVYKDDQGELQEIRIDDASVAPTSDVQKDLWSKFRVEVFAKNVLKGVTPLYDFESTFNYNLSQKDTLLTRNVEKITTHVNIVLKKDLSGVYKTVEPLKENENVLLYRDNLILEPTYPKFSNYVKVLYSLSGRGLTYIPANSRYELTGDDYIVFFWKSLNANRYYDYIKYDASSNSFSNFISPSFDMKCEQGGVDYKTYDTLKSTIKNLPAGVHGITSGFSANKDTTLDKFVAEMLLSEAYDTLQVLTGNNQISWYVPNRININNEKNGCKYLFWITNTREIYTDKLNPLNNKEVCIIPWENDTYTLQTGEYFFYTNNDHTVLHILGEGTTLHHTGLYGNWAVRYVPYESLLLEGISAIEEHLYSIPLSDLRVLEAVENEQILLGTGTSIYVSDVEYNSDNISVNDLTLIDGIISYQEEDKAIVTPEIIYADNIKWKATSVLNINVSPSKPQKIYKNQRITLIKTDGNAVTITGDDEQNNELISYIVSDHELSYRGGSNISVKVYSLADSGYIPVSILSYTANKDVSDKIVYTPDTGITMIDISDVITMPSFKLLEGEYLLKVMLDHDCPSFSMRMSNGTPLNPIYNNSNCYRLSIQEDSDISLTFKTEDPVLISVYPLKKFTTDTIDALGIDNDFLMETIAELDPGCDYNVTGDSVDIIQNPLNSTSFHNPIHFYNKFTIDEWKQMSDRDIRILSVFR